MMARLGGSRARLGTIRESMPEAGGLSERLSRLGFRPAGKARAGFGDPDPNASSARAVFKAALAAERRSRNPRGCLSRPPSPAAAGNPAEGYGGLFKRGMSRQPRGLEALATPL